MKPLTLFWNFDAKQIMSSSLELYIEKMFGK